MTRPKIKKVNTAARKKERKDVQKRLAARTSMMMQHPKKCDVCGKPFERTHETVKTWMVVVSEEKEITRLSCPKCWVLINEIAEKEKINED